MSIDLSFKNLEQLDQQLNLNNYTIINLQGNNFKGEQTYIQQLKVQHLNLSFNNIEHMWLLPSSIVTLEINNNLLQNLANISHLKNLKQIDLSNNLLQSVHWFSGLTNLTHLFLKNNKIKTIESLRTLPNLQEVDLECNELKNAVEIYSLESQNKINVINLFGNPLFDGLHLNILTSIEKNCHCKSDVVYLQSEISKRKQQQNDDIDLFDENSIDKQPEKQIEIQPQIMPTKKYTKSLSPLSKQLPQFYDPKSSKYVTFHEVLRQKQRGNHNTINQQNLTTTNATTTQQQISQTQITQMEQLKTQNENLKKDYIKLKQKYEQSQKQNQIFFQELESYKEQVQGILMQIGIQMSDEDSSLRILLDQLEFGVQQFVNTTHRQTMENLNSLMNRMGGKVKVMSSQIEIVTLKRFCDYTEKIKNIEVALSKLADVVIEQKQTILKLQRQRVHSPMQRQCLTSRSHNKNPSELDSIKLKNLFFKSAANMQQQEKCLKTQNSQITSANRSTQSKK